MLRKVVFGSGLISLVPVVQAATPIQEKPTGPSKPPPMRPSELPVYDTPHADYRDFLEAEATADNPGYIRSVLREPVRAVRAQAQAAWQQTDAIKNTVRDNYNEATDRTAWIVKYLREEENKEIRYGAVAMGGLTGFIFGLRGGIVKRLLYTGVGTTLMGAVCFPDESRGLARSNGALVKQYVNIAYNFLYGVKPGDPQLEVKLPELSFPKDLSEFVDLSVSLASTVRQAIMPPPAKEESSTSDKKE